MLKETKPGLVSFSIALGTYKSHSFLVIPYGWDNVPFPTEDRCATVEHFHLGLVGFQVFMKVISFYGQSVIRQQQCVVTYTYYNIEYASKSNLKSLKN